MTAKENIYVVDDDCNVLSSLCVLLKKRGFDARGFETAEDFLNSVEIDGPGCVITDLRMPGMDGRELQQRLLARDSSLGVVVVTGHADVPTTVQLMNNGAVTVLEKPYQTPALLRAVETALDRSHERLRMSSEARDIERRIAQLTDEELHVMHGMIAGTPIKALARQLGISMRTVDRRRNSVLRTMHAGSIGELGTLMAKRRPAGDDHSPSV